MGGLSLSESGYCVKQLVSPALLIKVRKIETLLDLGDVRTFDLFVQQLRPVQSVEESVTFDVVHTVL
jgi:hypothetical protein